MSEPPVLPDADAASARMREHALDRLHRAATGDPTTGLPPLNQDPVAKLLGIEPTDPPPWLPPWLRDVIDRAYLAGRHESRYELCPRCGDALTAEVKDTFRDL